MTNAADESSTVATSPAATGPAGSLFEGQVGAFYLLSMLADGEPRGLPGTNIERIEFQRAPDGRPLDDVIVHAVDRQSRSAVLEVQVKRTVDFTPSDTVFQSVVKQVAKASSRSDFNTTRYELSVAIERTSTQIERTYQEVLLWARRIGSPEIFFAHIERKGQSNAGMRCFVETFGKNLELAGAPHDETAVWCILRRFQILVLDFNQTGSASEYLAHERAAMLLSPQDLARAADLWSVLTNLALLAATSAGDFTLEALRNVLISEHNFHFKGDRRLAPVRKILAEASANALADIKDRIGVVCIDREQRMSDLYRALETGRYVEIRGDAGVGKSGILKHLAEKIGLEAQAVVLSPDRTIPNGWPSLRSTLGCDASAREFLSDLASNGGAVLFIDNLDFFDDNTKRATINDLVRAAADIPNFCVVVTARRDFGMDEPSWLPSEALDLLGRAQPVLIGDLNDDEITQLKTVNSSLAALLTDNHPARDVIRNLFRLKRLVTQASGEPVPHTEAEMALQWWDTADGAKAGRRERQRLLKDFAIYALSTAESMAVRDHLPATIEALKSSGTLREPRTDFVAFQHDVFHDWAIGCLLYEEPKKIGGLPLNRPTPATLIRGIEIGARLMAEQAINSTNWKALLDQLSQSNVHGSWRRTVLLAVVRSELGTLLLTRMVDSLSANKGALLKDLIRITIAVDSKPGVDIFSESGIDPALIPDNFLFPKSLSWSRLIIWSLSAMQQIPKTVIPDLITLYSKWIMAMLGRDPLTPILLSRLHSWLVELETALHPINFEFGDQRHPFGSNLSSTQEYDLEA